MPINGGTIAGASNTYRCWTLDYTDLQAWDTLDNLSSAGPVSTLRNADSGQGYTVSGNTINTLAPGGSRTGHIDDGTTTGDALLSLGGLSAQLSGDAVLSGTVHVSAYCSPLYFYLTANTYIYVSSATNVSEEVDVYIVVNGTSTSIANVTVSSSAVGISLRLKWVTTGTTTTIYAGYAIPVTNANWGACSTLPSLTSYGTLTGLTAIAPAITIGHATTGRASYGGHGPTSGSTYAIPLQINGPTTLTGIYTDSVSVSDTGAYAGSGSQSESVSVSDGTAATATSASTQGVSVSESSVTSGVAANTDSVAIAESTTYAAANAGTDTVTLAEAVAMVASTTNGSESVTVADGTGTVVGVASVDTVPIQETMIAAASMSSSNSVTIAENVAYTPAVSYSDSVVVGVDIRSDVVSAAYTDSVSVNESAQWFTVGTWNLVDVPVSVAEIAAFTAIASNSDTSTLADGVVFASAAALLDGGVSCGDALAVTASGVGTDSVTVSDISTYGGIVSSRDSVSLSDGTGCGSVGIYTDGTIVSEQSLSRLIYAITEACTVSDSSVWFSLVTAVWALVDVSLSLTETVTSQSITASTADVLSPRETIAYLLASSLVDGALHPTDTAHIYGVLPFAAECATYVPNGLAVAMVRDGVAAGYVRDGGTRVSVEREEP